MGNVFDGATESFFLYVGIPGALLASLIALVGFRIAFARRAARHAASWGHAATDAHSYRGAAARPIGVPARVWWLATATFAWGAGILAFWLLAAIGAAVLVGASAFLVVPASMVAFGGLSCARLSGAALALSCREPRVTRALEVARRWISAHHAIVSSLGTALLGVVLVDRLDALGSSRVVEMAIAYAVVVLVPSALGVVLWRQLRAVALELDPSAPDGRASLSVSAPA